MLGTTEKILDSGFAAHAFTEVDLVQLFDGTPASRYAIVNKALKKGELVRLRRGLYILCEKYLPIKLSKYYLANRISQHSYISLETALAYHGWIPERVTSINSVSNTKRRSSFQTKFGEYNYYSIPTNKYEFLTGVSRVTINNLPFFMANPLRALADLVYVRKMDWQGMEFLTEGLRIEKDELSTIDKEEINRIKKVYRSKRVLSFLNALEKESTRNVS